MKNLTLISICSLTHLVYVILNKKNYGENGMNWGKMDYTDSNITFIFKRWKRRKYIVPVYNDGTNVCGKLYLRWWLPTDQNTINSFLLSQE